MTLIAFDVQPDRATVVIDDPARVERPPLDLGEPSQAPEGPLAVDDEDAVHVLVPHDAKAGAVLGAGDPGHGAGAPCGWYRRLGGPL